jgi:protein phosphatase
MNGGWENDDSTLIEGFPPPSATVEVEFGAQSRRGRARLVNEDNYLIIQLGRHQETLMTSLPETAIARRFEEHGYGMAVADGMGGSGTGEIASRLALVTLVQLVRYYARWNLRVNEPIAREIMERAQRFYRHIDAAIALERVEGQEHGLQTTLTATFGAGRDLFFAHVGHSRAYLFRDGELLRLTRDHTVGRGGRSSVGLAPLVDVNAAARDLKHVLTGTIGMAGPSGPAIDLERFQINDEDLVILCTNGLTDAMDEVEIAAVLESGRSPAELCATLVDRAVAAGGQDDATALIGRYRVPRTE